MFIKLLQLFNFNFIKFINLPLPKLMVQQLFQDVLLSLILILSILIELVILLINVILFQQEVVHIT